MKLQKRALAFLLAVMLLLGCFPSLGVTAEVVAKSDAGAELFTAYDELYVQKGLVMLLSAYDQAKAGLVSEDGIYTGWTNKMDGTVASLHNYTDSSNSANNVWWKMRTGKGIGYDLTEAQYRNGSNNNPNAPGIKAYLYLGNGIVDVTKDYTVEYASSLLRISNDGVQAENGGNYYNIASSTEKFGAWGSWVYLLNQGGALRSTYFPSSPKDGYGSVHTPVWDISTWSNDPSVKTSSNVISVDVAADTSFRNFYANGELRSFYYSGNGNTYTQMSIKQNYNASYKSVITTSTEFWLMQNCANTLYAVRVYDRALSEEEIAWNTLVDIAAYVGADVSVLAACGEEQRLLIATETDALTFASSKEDVESAIAASIFACAPVAEGYQISKDGDALRIWASMVTFEDVSKLGMTITFKQNGTVIYSKSGETTTAFASIRANGEELVAEDYALAGYYAASVKGFAAGAYTVEVTPYAILTDGSRFTGLTYSEEITFEF